MALIDCRGLACPEPVVMTKRALDALREGGELTVILDDPASCENVKRFLQSEGCSVTLEERSNEFHIRVLKPGGHYVQGLPLQHGKKEVVLYLNSNVVGVGDDTLGALLMRTFLKTILDAEERPSKVILINSGVRLASEGSDVLETLQTLSRRGIEVLSCGTCLDFYRLKEKLAVGKVTNMYDIVRFLLAADRVLRP